MVLATAPWGNNRLNAAFVISLVATALLCAIVPWYAKKRPLDAKLTWGEAAVAACYVCAMFVLAYGIVPHQWLIWADNELDWRASKFLVRSAQEFQLPVIGLRFSPPFDINYVVVRDFIEVNLYAGAVVGQVMLWNFWQSRGTPKKKRGDKADSAYGRPLVKTGSA